VVDRSIFLFATKNNLNFPCSGCASKSNRPKVAIAAHTFDKPSETFIRNHAEKILPEETVLIALDKDGTFPHDCNSEDSFKFSSQVACVPQKLNSLRRLLVGGSVFYQGNHNNRQLATFLKKKNIRVLLAEYGPVGCAVERACRMAGVRLYVHFHGYDASVLIQTWHIRSAYRKLFRASSGFIFPSNFLANKLCSSIGIEWNESVHVVPCCVNAEEFGDVKSKDQNLVLAVGRFVQKKAPNNTILAFSKLLQNLPGLRLEMIGDGELLSQCKSLVETLGIKKQVVFHGSKSYGFVKEKMAKANLFLQHSVCAPNGDVEGLPVAVLEAMVAGAVVVATRHSGIPEAVVDGETGFLVDENDVEGMYQSCLRILKDEELLDSMRKKARQRVEEKFTVEQQMFSLREIMELNDV